MIRINLIPTTDKKKRGAALAENFSTVFIVVLLIEILGCYFWFSSADQEAAVANAAKQKVEIQLKAEERKRKKASKKKKVSGDVEKLTQQIEYFKRLKPKKTGLVEMLMYLSYVLTNVDDSLENQDEQVKQEAAGWRRQFSNRDKESAGDLLWNPRFVWLNEITEKEGEITLKGLAQRHEFVAEFYRRLESGIYFLQVRPQMQAVTADADFEQIELVEFKATATFNPRAIFDPKKDLIVYMAAEDVPPSMQHMIVEEKAPAAKGKDKGKKGKGKGKGKAKKSKGGK